MQTALAEGSGRLPDSRHVLALGLEVADDVRNGKAESDDHPCCQEEIRVSLFIWEAVCFGPVLLPGRFWIIQARIVGPFHVSSSVWLSKTMSGHFVFWHGRKPSDRFLFCAHILRHAS